MAFKQEPVLKSNVIFMPIKFSFPAGCNSLPQFTPLSHGLPAISFKLPANISLVQLVFIEDTGVLQTNKGSVLKQGPPE